MKKKPPKSIYIPHLHYTIKVFDLHRSKSKDPLFNRMRDRKCTACAISRDTYTGEIYLQFPIKPEHVGTVGHEIVHILQYIAEARSIRMDEEKEHFGYLFQYIYNELMGYDYIKT